MKNLLLATVGMLALGVGAASAADLPRREVMPVKAPYVSQMYNWSGAYVGINGGYGWNGGSSSADGGLAGGTLGFNYQTGSVVWGLETDIDWSGIKGSSACGIDTCSVDNNWLGTARGRLGFAMGPTGSFMPYITGGLAYGSVKYTNSGFGSVTDTNVGWTLGAGIEAALVGPWTAKVEYLYVDLGDSPSVGGVSTDMNANIVRAGLNYRF